MYFSPYSDSLWCTVGIMPVGLHIVKKFGCFWKKNVFPNSLCNIHGILIATQQSVHQLDEGTDSDGDYCHIKEVSAQDTHTIKKVQFNLGPQTKRIDKSTKPVSSSPSKVQCWLCDGPHAFRQCTELICMKNICFKHPQVREHFQQLLLNKNGEAVKVLLDAPELFDHDPYAKVYGINDGSEDQLNEENENISSGDEQVNY